MLEGSEGMKNKRVIILVSIVIVVIGGIIGGIYGKYKWSLHKEEKAMESYLEKKYATDFVIKNPRYEMPYLGSPWIFKADLYPVSDKSLIFNCSRDGEEYHEFFLKFYWQKQAKTEREVRDYFESYFNPIPKYGISINVDGVEFHDEFSKGVPAFSQDTISKYGENVSFALYIKDARQIDNDFANQHAKEFFYLVKFIKQYKTKKSYLFYPIGSINNKSTSVEIKFKTEEIQSISSLDDVQRLLQDKISKLD